jgi:hypothetical protein
MKLRVVKVRIRELVLRGFAPGERYRIGDAVHNELVRLLSVQPDALRALGHGRATAEIDAGEFRMPAGSHPAFVGRQVAGAIYRGLKP